ncbi:docking protein 2-like isoform X2 [Nerophis ophidion]|uniref:docking protein 2-like isoform X2 n=1 Tax=Nerophis ophidion TaxID=159077 RepID=UPI002ADF4479|nr:docking protein 2-like isoform X2 [Nerophis ophidion]
MEEDVKKEGRLYLQHQHTFGKKWKSVWCVLFGESCRSIPRLEVCECKDGGERGGRRHQDHKKVIRLSDCVRVAEAEVEAEAAPKDTACFLLETTHRNFLFAAHAPQLWTTLLCQAAFPVSWAGPISRGRGSQQKVEEEGMEDNILYSTQTLRDFRVCVRRTESSERCRLKKEGVLRASSEVLHLLDTAGVVTLSWPYRFLRRFGRDKNTFTFEAGRRCESGEGSFEFDTKEGNFLFQAVEAAISQQRARHARRGGPVNMELCAAPTLPPLPASYRDDPQSSAAQVDVDLLGVDKLTLVPKKRVHVICGSPLNPDLCSPAPWSLEQTYSQVTWDTSTPHLPKDDPFHAVSKKDPLSAERPLDSEVLTPAYEEEDHVYNEPQSCLGPPSEYDDPEELKGDAWRTMATAVDRDGPSRRSLPVARQEAEGEEVMSRIRK